MAKPQDTRTHPDAARDRRMSRADGCPECLRRDNLPFHTTTRDAGGPGAFRAFYWCADGCRHCWVTSWADEDQSEPWT